MPILEQEPYIYHSDKSNHRTDRIDQSRTRPRRHWPPGSLGSSRRQDWLCLRSWWWCTPSVLRCKNRVGKALSANLIKHVFQRAQIKRARWLYIGASSPRPSISGMGMGCEMMRSSLHRCNTYNPLHSSLQHEHYINCCNIPEHKYESYTAQRI
jgi:hypothetical protein